MYPLEVLTFGFGFFCVKSLHQDQGQALHKGGKHNLANQQYLSQSLRQYCVCGLQLQ